MRVYWAGQTGASDLSHGGICSGSSMLNWVGTWITTSSWREPGMHWKPIWTRGVPGWLPHSRVRLPPAWPGTHTQCMRTPASLIRIFMANKTAQEVHFALLIVYLWQGSESLSVCILGRGCEGGRARCYRSPDWLQASHWLPLLLQDTQRSEAGGAWVGSRAAGVAALLVCTLDMYEQLNTDEGLFSLCLSISRNLSYCFIWFILFISFIFFPPPVVWWAAWPCLITTGQRTCWT